MAADIRAALELAGELDEFRQEATTTLERFQNEVSVLEIESLLSEETDRASALLTINAGAGGTESCDWANMLLRMYTRFCERQNWRSNYTTLSTV